MAGARATTTKVRREENCILEVIDSLSCVYCSGEDWCIEDSDSIAASNK